MLRSARTMATNYWCCGTMLAIFLFLVHLNLEAATKQNEDFFQFENNSLDISILKSKNEKFLIYRNTGKKECYIERVTKNSEDEQNSRTLYVGQEQLMKSDKVYTELDDDTKNFCNQFALFVLQEQPPIYIKKGKQVRKRRGAQIPKPRYRSQTQTQYIYFDGGRGNNTAAPTQLIGDPGNPRITISGNLRLEQSQSQFETFDCNECNSWPQGSQTIETPKYPQPSEVNSLSIGQSFVPSNQQQTGSPPQNFVPGNPPSGVHSTDREIILPSVIPNQQLIPPSGTTYQANGNSHFSGSLPKTQSSENVSPQLSAYFTPGSLTQQVIPPETSPNLSSSSQFIPQPGSENVLPHYQVPGSGFKPAQHSSFTNPPVNHRTAPILLSNSQPTIQGVIRPSNPAAPQNFLPGTRQQNSGSSTPFQNGQYFPVIALPVDQYSTGNVNNQTHAPVYFYLALQPSQQHTEVPQYFLFNTQSIYPQNSHGIITSPQGSSYSTPTAQPQPVQTVPQIYSNWQAVPHQSSNPQGTRYFPPSNQNTHQSGYSEGVINPQIYPSTDSSSQGITEQSSGEAIHFPVNSEVNSDQNFQAGSTNTQSIANVPQTYFLEPQQNIGEVITQPQTQPKTPTNFPSGYQMGSDSAGGKIYCQSCSYIPTGGTATTNALSKSHPTLQQGSGYILPTVQQNSGERPQTQPNQVPTVFYPSPTVHDQHGTFSPSGLVVDSKFPFQTQYTPQTYVPYQQPQGVSTGTQINKSGAASYVPSPTGQSNFIYPHVESSTVTNTNYPHDTPSTSKNCTNESPTIHLPTTNQNESSINTVEDDIVEDAQSFSSINIINNATRAEAISQGKTKKGIVKAEVSGTYTKDFAAKAQTIHNERSAISQIFGNATGAVSTSYGKAGNSESKSQVLYSHETGSAIAESQGGGLVYNLTGQIQVGTRGGQADSQATGPGSTFSQAQFGFVPILNENFIQQSIFQGGGTASSNISRHYGSTGIKFQGQYQSGPQFTGQIQAGAGKVSQNRSRIAFNSTNLTKLPQKDTSSNAQVDKVADFIVENERIDESKGTSTFPLKLILPQPSENNSLDTLIEFGTETFNLQKRLLRGQSSNNQKSIQNGKNNMINVDPSSNKFLHAGQIIPGTKNFIVPSGFRGRLLPQDVQSSDIRTSITNSGRTTEIDYRGPLKQGKVYIQKDNFDDQQHSLEYGSNGFTTVTKSETGELKDKNRNYDHTYYTKSSTCGFFTYTCNLIDSPDGRTQICKQAPPTDVNGNPC